jgi:hypothetical protein
MIAPHAALSAFAGVAPDRIECALPSTAIAPLFEKN